MLRYILPTDAVTQSTEKAIKVTVAGSIVWLPKSQIDVTYGPDAVVLLLPAWLAVAKELPAQDIVPEGASVVPVAPRVHEDIVWGTVQGAVEGVMEYPHSPSCWRRLREVCAQARRDGYDITIENLQLPADILAVERSYR